MANPNLQFASLDLSTATLYSTASNTTSFIRITGDFINGQNTITNVTDVVGYYGTSSFQVILDMSQMKDNITEGEYEEANEKIDIDEAFDKVKTETDGCEISSLKIINNVANITYTIKEDTGMNDKYELDI